jgi:hypothetical protein
LATAFAVVFFWQKFVSVSALYYYVDNFRQRET